MRRLYMIYLVIRFEVIIMATWPKEECPIPFISETTGLLEETAHTVEVYPTTETYPTGKITCTQASGK